MEAIEETQEEEEGKSSDKTVEPQDLTFPTLSTLPPVFDAHQDLESNYRNLHGLVQDVVTRNNFMLMSKYVNRVKQEETKLTDLRRKISEAQIELDHNPTIDSVMMQISQFKAQVATMSKRATVLEGEWAVVKDEVEERSKDVKELRDELYHLNRDNMTLSYQIDELTEAPKLPSPDPLFPPSLSTPTLSLTPPPDRSHSIAKELVKPPLDISASSERFSDLLRSEIFFQQCLRTARHQLLRSEEVPRDSKGLRGSLYFELISCGGKPMSPGKTYRSSLMDRDYKNVVYHTVKRMISNARSGIKQKQLAAMDIPINQLKKYAPMQILGLLCLRNDVIGELHSKVFPANILRVDTCVDELGSPCKPRQSSLPPIYPPRYVPSELHLNRSRIARELQDKHSVSLI